NQIATAPLDADIARDAGNARGNCAGAGLDVLSVGEGLHARADPKLAERPVRAGAAVLGDRQKSAERGADRADGAGEAALWLVRAVGVAARRMALRRRLCGDRRARGWRVDRRVWLGQPCRLRAGPVLPGRARPHLPS